MSHPGNDAYHEAMVEAQEEAMTDAQWAQRQQEEEQRWWEQEDKDSKWIKAVTTASDNRYLKCQ